MQWLMLQQEHPEDFTIATGIQHSVRDFVNIAAKELGMEIQWQGKGSDEIGILVGDTLSPNMSNSQRIDINNLKKVIIRVDPRYYRPTEVESLLGDSTKAHQKLGWSPKITFKQLVEEMIREDFKIAERDELIRKHGYKVMDYHE